MSELAVATDPTKKIELAEPPHVLKETSLQSSEFAYARMSATLPVGWTLEDALKPEFWVRVVHKFQKTPVTGEPDKTGAIIELRTVDHAFYAQLYVRAVQEKGLIVQLIGEPQYFGSVTVESNGFDIRWNVGKRGYDIIRKTDREIVGDGAKFPTKELANEWIAKTMRAN
jgi:hypothetical protein